MLAWAKRKITMRIDSVIDRINRKINLHNLQEQVSKINTLLQPLLIEQNKTVENNISKYLPLALSPTSDRVYTHTKDGHRIFLDLYDLHMTCHVLEHGIWEEHVRYVFKKFLKPAAIVADIGANIGLHALYLGGLVGPGGKVYCFEPAPRTAAILKTNIDINGYNAWVHVIEKAISNENETREFEYLPTQAGMSSFKSTNDKAQEKITVETTTLDSFFKNNMKIDLLKIDIEGFEYEALLGAKKLFDYNENLVVLLEYRPDIMRKLLGENSISKLFSFFKERAYKVYATSWPIEKMVYYEFDDPALTNNSFDLVFTKEKVMD